MRDIETKEKNTKGFRRNMSTRHQKTCYPATEKMLGGIRKRCANQQKQCYHALDKHKQPDTFYQAAENMLASTRKHLTKYQKPLNHKSENILQCIMLTNMRKHVTQHENTCFQAPENM